MYANLRSGGVDAAWHGCASSEEAAKEQESIVGSRREVDGNADTCADTQARPLFSLHVTRRYFFDLFIAICVAHPVTFWSQKLDWNHDVKQRMTFFLKLHTQAP